MATRYVRGVTGNNANTGADWNNAKQTVAGALAIATNNDIIAVDSGESFTANAAITWTPPAGVFNLAILSVFRSGTTGFSRFAGAAEHVGAAVASSFSITAINGSNIYIYGMTLGTGTVDFAVCGNTSTNLRCEFASCTFILNSTNSVLTLGPSVGSGVTYSVELYFRYCVIRTPASRTIGAVNIGSAYVNFAQLTLDFQGASIPGYVFGGQLSTDIPNLVVQDSDLSNEVTPLVSIGSIYRGSFLFKNCKLSTAAITLGSWSTPAGNASITLRNCDSADTINVFTYMDAFGTLTVVTNPLVNSYMGTAFARTGVTWSIATTSLASEFRPFVCPILEGWTYPPGTTSGAVGFNNKVARIEFTAASAFTDRQVWGELSYPASASAPNYTVASSRNAEPFTGTGVNLTSSNVSWSGSPTTNRQVLRFPFSLVEVGLLQARVFIGTPSATIYMNPLINLYTAGTEP